MEDPFSKRDYGQLLEQKLAHLDYTENLAEIFAESYLKIDHNDGSLEYSTEICPELVPQVYEAFTAARQESEVGCQPAKSDRTFYAVTCV